MPLTLTDADRAEIERIIGPRENQSLRTVLAESIESGILYGKRAGRAEAIAEAAGACRREKVDAKATGEEADRAYNAACDHCAAAIRALADA